MVGLEPDCEVSDLVGSSDNLDCSVDSCSILLGWVDNYSGNHLDCNHLAVCDPMDIIHLLKILHMSSGVTSSDKS